VTYLSHFKGSDDEYHAVLWLNPKAHPSLPSHHEKDGLTIFDTSTAECLHSKAIRIHPETHPNFLSFNGNINLNISALCKKGFSELISREDNRIIIIGPRRPFQFSTSYAINNRDINNNIHEGNFEIETMMAVVIKVSYI
jgi:hypothetical protein